MPELCRFRGIVIRMYPDDHARPHFHAKYADDEVSVEIGSWRVTGSLPPSRMRLVNAWARTRHDELTIAWDRMQSGLPPGKIDP